MGRDYVSSVADCKWMTDSAWKGFFIEGYYEKGANKCRQGRDVKEEPDIISSQAAALCKHACRCFLLTKEYPGRERGGTPSDGVEALPEYIKRNMDRIDVFCKEECNVK